MKQAKLAILAITASLISVTAFGQPSSPPSNARPAISVVPIYLTDLRAIAALRIGDHPPAPVVFDTGATSNTIDSDYAAALKLEFDPTVHVHVGDGTGNTFEAKQAKVPVATLGEVPLTAKTATVFPYKERDVVGIFVPNSFAGRQVLLDLRHGRLIVRSRGAGNPCSNGTPYTPSGLPTVMLHLPGLSLPAVLDTGSNSPLVLDTRLARKLPLRRPLQSAGKGTTVTGQHDVYEARLASEIRIGPLALRNPTVKFSSSDASVPYMGLPIIRQLLIMLDPEQQ
ncbi:MAG TPA: retropepsin-like aspartic protease, partial [Sphingomicrobium sp.]|nr:retropepsin-like aspartic protease [Sphingomicrobium sp.]